MYCEGEEIMQGLNSAPVGFDYAYTSMLNKDTKAIPRTHNDAEVHNTRGIAYSENGEQNRAIATFSKAMGLKPDFAEAYNNRGEAWLHLKEWDKARAALTAAEDLRMDIIAAFYNDSESVEAYERANHVKLPADIATMLTEQ